MDTNDLQAELMQARKKIHDLANAAMVHDAQISELLSTKSELSNNIKLEFLNVNAKIDKISDSLSGGFEGSGLVNRVENLEVARKQSDYWLRAIGTAVLTIIVTGIFTYVMPSLFYQRNATQDDYTFVRSDDEIKAVPAKKDKKEEI